MISEYKGKMQEIEDINNSYVAKLSYDNFIF